SRERSPKFYRLPSSFDPRAAPLPPRLFSSRLYPIVSASPIETITDKRVGQSDRACRNGRTWKDIRMTWFVRTLAHALALAVAIVGTPALAQDYPTRPVTIVVGYTPGATSDLLARTVAERLNAAWGQSVIVDNRSGVGGNIAAAYVARAPADG